MHSCLCLWDCGGVEGLEIGDEVMPLNFRYISKLYGKQSFLCLKYKSQISMLSLSCLGCQWVKLHFLIQLLSFVEKWQHDNANQRVISTSADTKCQFSSVQFTSLVMLDSLQPHGLQHARLPCPSPTPGIYLNSNALSRWCHPTISSSVDTKCITPQIPPLPGSL